MRDYRQSPSSWPFTADLFWSVKFVFPSKSIKGIQWDSFPHWAVIALVIGKLWKIILLQAKENPDTNFLHGCFTWRTWYCRQHKTFTHAKMLLVPMNFFLWRVDYALEENFLTEQMWFLLLISYWKVVTRILIFCGCLWSAWFVLWCKSIFFDLFWKVKLFNAAK